MKLTATANRPGSEPAGSAAAKGSAGSATALTALIRLRGIRSEPEAAALTFLPFSAMIFFRNSAAALKVSAAGQPADRAKAKILPTA